MPRLGLPPWEGEAPAEPRFARREFGSTPHGAPMKLSDHLTPALIRIPLRAEDKTAAITELVDLVAQNGLVASRDALLEAVLRREAQRSTGIGRGLAIPHAKIDAVPQLTIALGRAARPIDFASLDGKPVELVALLASPISATSAHIQALAGISRLVMNDAVHQRLLAAVSADELYRVIHEYDANP